MLSSALNGDVTRVSVPWIPNTRAKLSFQLRKALHCDPAQPVKAISLIQMPAIMTGPTEPAGSMESKGTESLLWYLSIAYLVFAVIAGAWDIVYVLQHHIAFPFGDQWIWLAKLHERGVFQALYSQYNEHRLVIPGLFFLADYRYFGARNAFLAVVLLLFQIGCAALLMIPVWRHREIPKAARLVFCGFVTITMLWFIQAEDFFYPYQLQISCANFGVLATLHVFARLAGRDTAQARPALWLSMAMLASALWATFSFGHGMLIWPVLLVMGLVVRLPKRLLAAILLVFCAVLAVYFAGYRTPPLSASPLESLRHPVRIAYYATVLMGLPFFGANTPGVTLVTHFGHFAITLGGILLAAAALLRFAVVNGEQKSPDQVIYCSMMLTALGAAVLAGLTRSHFPIEQALSGRYAPMPLTFWVSLAAVVTIDLFRWEPPGGLGRMMWCGMLIMASFVTLSTQSTMGRYMAQRARNQALAALSMGVGVPDKERVEDEMASLPLVSFVDRKSAGYLGHSLFAFPGTEWLGTPLLDHFVLTPGGACLGSVDIIAPLPGLSPPGARLTGWAWDSQGRRRTSRIWVTDSRAIIRGLGLVDEARPDVAAAYGNPKMESAGWIAYSRVPADNGSFTVYAELNDGVSVCQVGPAHSP